MKDLLGELAELGVAVQPASPANLEQRWLHELADYHGCLGEMLESIQRDISDDPVTEKQKRFLGARLSLQGHQLDWELHCRIRGGRLIFYRPNLPHGIMQDAAAGYSPSHNISYASDNRGSGQVMKNILENEGTLSLLKDAPTVACAPSAHLEDCPNKSNAAEEVQHLPGFIL